MAPARCYFPLWRKEVQKCVRQTPKKTTGNTHHILWFLKLRTSSYNSCTTATTIYCTTVPGIYNCSFSLASKGPPSRYSKTVCVRLHSDNSEPTMLISQTTPDEHPLTPPPCRWQALITLPTLPKFQLL